MDLRLIVGLVLALFYVILSEEKNILKGLIVFIIGVAATTLLTPIIDSLFPENPPPVEAPAEPTLIPEPAKPTPIILHVKNSEEGINVKNQPSVGNSVVIELHDPNISILFNNNTAQGYGSDNLLHDWYEIEVNDISGWVRSDYIELQAHGYYEKTVEGAMNIRSSNTFNSPIVATIHDGTRLEYLGEKMDGLGSDNSTHEWMKVKTVGTFKGWVRGDLTTR